MTIGPYLQIDGRPDQVMIDWLNTWQPEVFCLLGSGAEMAYLLDNLVYIPRKAFLRVWFQHEMNLDVSGGTVTVDPDHFNNFLQWGRETNEYRVHKDPDTGLVYRPDFPAQWNQIWERGTNAELRCVQKLMAWTRADWDAVRGRSNVYAIAFLGGVKQPIIPEYFTFEQERIGAMWDGGWSEQFPSERKLKSTILSLGTGQYAPDRRDLWDSPQWGSLAATLKAYPQTTMSLHAYAHGSQKFEFGDCVVTDESPTLFPKPPHEYVKDFKIYPASERRAWAAFLPHLFYHEVMVPSGLGGIRIDITEGGYDRPYKERWPEMVQVYYRGQEPGGAWEYAYQNDNWPISHWRHLQFLDPNLDNIQAAVEFMAYDFAWTTLQDEVFSEIDSRLLFQFRTDESTDWANYNFFNFHVFPNRYKEALSNLRRGLPPKSDEPKGCPPLSFLSGLLK